MPLGRITCFPFFHVRLIFLNLFFIFQGAFSDAFFLITPPPMKFKFYKYICLCVVCILCFVLNKSKILSPPLSEVPALTILESFPLPQGRRIRLGPGLIVQIMVERSDQRMNSGCSLI